MNFNNQDLEAFLIEAQLVNQKVKALAQNKISPEQFDHLERLRQQDKKRKQEAKVRKQQQLLNKNKQGHEGKGISKDFKNFCYFCRWEYELETPNCLKCKKRTMTLDERQKQLEVMVNDYKYKKKNREERKHRWEMWKKTQESLWKKTSNNYSKWDYFVSDSEEQPQQEPILPKNDPNFMALQADLQERKKRKQKDHSEANKLKQKGNQLMKQGNYEQAMHKYTLALEHAKDIKSVYTNRALAYIKLKKFKKAIKDCTNVIEYMEIFEKTGDNKDLTFKAYSRRAIANKEIKEYKNGLNDINQALKLFPDDKNGLLLKKQLQGLAEHAEKVERLLRQNAKVNPEKNSTQAKVEKPQDEEPQEKEEQMQEMDDQAIRVEERKIAKQLFQQQEKQQQKANEQKKEKKNKKEQTESITKPKDTEQTQQSKYKLQQAKISPIQQNIQNLTPEVIKQTFNLLVKNKDMIAIFIAGKGIQACLKQILASQFSNQEALLISLCLDGSGVGQKAVWDYGIDKLHDRIRQLLNDTSNQKHHALQVCSDIFQILVPISLYQSYRIKLANDNKIHIFIEQTYTKLINKKKTRTQLLNIFIIYMSNLLSGADSGLKNAYFIKQKVKTIVDSFFVYILDERTHNRNFLDLKKNVYGLLANFATHQQHRKTIVDFFNTNNKFAEICNDLQQYPKSQNNFTEYIESILSVLVNITFDNTLELPQLAEVLVSRFVRFRKVFSKEIVYRSLLVISRLKYSNPQIASKWLQYFEQISLEQKPLQHPGQKCNMSQIVKLLNILYTPVNGVSLQAEIPMKLFTVLSIYVRDNLVHENLFCNTANFFGVLAQSNLGTKEKVYEQVALGMKRLVDISKDKIGNWRKNAAILIAKCSSNLKVRQAMDKEHAMDVIKTIAHLIAGK